MSTIKVSNVQHGSAAAAAITLDANGQATLNGLAYPTSGSLSGRNRIINGDMRIDQRNAGASVSETGSGQYTLDRWQVAGTTSAGVFSVQQISDAPADFTNSLRITVTTASASPGADASYQLQQKIEGFNSSDLSFGTASAKTITLSFWVKSSITGTMGGVLTNSAYNRTYPFQYTISSANTWEQKSITIAGDTTGTWLTNNGVGLFVLFGLGAGSNRQATANVWANTVARIPSGSTQLIATLNATWQLTGVQLEAGSVATPFERRPYGQELVLCQRYYYKIAPGSAGRILMSAGLTPNANQFNASTAFPVTMRTRPTSLEQSGTAGDYLIYHAGTSSVCSSVPGFNTVTSADFACVDFTATAALTVGRSGLAGSVTSSAYLAWSAEL